MIYTREEELQAFIQVNLVQSDSECHLPSLASKINMPKGIPKYIGWTSKGAKRFSLADHLNQKRHFFIIKMHSNRLSIYPTSKSLKIISEIAETLKIWVGLEGGCRKISNYAREGGRQAGFFVIKFILDSSCYVYKLYGDTDNRVYYGPLVELLVERPGFGSRASITSTPVK